jgi:cell division protein FtsQ
LVLAAGALLALAHGGRWALRHIEFFRIRQVELEGLRYLSPDKVVSALELGPRPNLFDPLGPIERRLESLPGVVRARVERVLPGTLRIGIVEQAAIAFLPGSEGLVPVDSAGQPLPYDPVAGGLDLPVLAGADEAVLSVLALVRRADSVFYHEVQAAGRGEDGSVWLELDGRRVLFSAAPGIDVVRAVAIVSRELEASGRRRRELDARYAGWVIARRERT